MWVTRGCACAHALSDTRSGGEGLSAQWSPLPRLRQAATLRRRWTRRGRSRRQRLTSRALARSRIRSSATWKSPTATRGSRAAFASRTGQRANWCTFATWASRQAGRTIRCEDLGDTLAAASADPPACCASVESLWRRAASQGPARSGSRLGRLAAGDPLAVRRVRTRQQRRGTRQSEGVRGDRPRVRALPARLPRGRIGAPSAVAAFLDACVPAIRRMDRTYLRRAFSHYQQQAHEADPRTRAGLVLLANLCIGLHEQTRLQPEIARSRRRAARDGGGSRSTAC